MIFVLFVLFMIYVIRNCCVLFDLTGNTIDDHVQQQHLTLPFIYIENVIRLVLFVILLQPLKI